MKKIVLCFFGVIPRSIKYTFQSIKENIIDVLTDNNYEIEIYVFNLNIETTKIDDVKINQSDISIIPYNFFEEEKQSNIDVELEFFKQIKSITFTRSDYTEGIVKNCLRQMYSEFRVGLFLEKNQAKYDIAIVCGPDFFIANKLDITEIESSYINNTFYTTTTNDAQGYSNGFYFGKPSVLINPLKRMLTIEDYMPANRDYEYILQQSLEKNNITRTVSSIFFFKIRANKKVFFRHSDLYIELFSRINFDLIVKQYINLINALNFSI